MTWLLLHSLHVEVELRVKWLGSTIQITQNGRRSNHWSLDDGFRSNAWRSLNILWGLRIGWSLTRCLSRARGPGTLWWNTLYWWLWGRRYWRSPCQISALRRAKRHSTLRRWYGQGLRGLRLILRSWGAWPSLARCERVYMAPSGAHHSWYGWEVDCFASSWWPRGVDWWGFCFTRWQWTLATKDACAKWWARGL